MFRTIPESTKYIAKMGMITVEFGEDYKEDNHLIMGENVIITDDDEILIKWLKTFDGFAKGIGSPMQEKFEIVHI